MAGGAVCILMLVVLGVAAFMINVVLPIYLIYKVVTWIAAYARNGELPWHKKSRPQAAGELAAALAREREAGLTAAEKVAGLEAALAGAREEAAREQADKARAAAAPAESDFASPAREAVFVKLKKEGRLDRLALVYYVEDALKSGMAPAAVAAALRAKGWPEEEIAAVVPG